MLLPAARSLRDGRAVRISNILRWRNLKLINKVRPTHPEERSHLHQVAPRLAESVAQSRVITKSQTRGPCRIEPTSARRIQRQLGDIKLVLFPEFVRVNFEQQL